MTRQNFTQDFTIAELKKSIVFEDQHLLVINKPAGLLSQGGDSGDANIVDLLREYLGRPYVGLIHRLDRNTSGLMVVAKRSKAAERLTQSLQSGKLQRKYVAILHGVLPLGEDLHWSHWLQKDEAENKTRVFSKPGQNTKEAKLKLTVLKVFDFDDRPLSLVTLELETGRSHQIRAQASFEGHPLLGDAKYGAPHTKFPRTALHSYLLNFPHPKDGVGEQNFRSPLPDDFLHITALRSFIFD